jgi:hypothetical protein
MAARVLNRRELRQPEESVKPAAQDVPATATTPRKKKATTPVAPKARKARAKKAPPRLRARWAVFDGTMKQVAIFDYNQRAAVDEKLVDLRAKRPLLPANRQGANARARAHRSRCYRVMMNRLRRGSHIPVRRVS